MIQYVVMGIYEGFSHIHKTDLCTFHKPEDAEAFIQTLLLPQNRPDWKKNYSYLTIEERPFVIEMEL